MPSNRDLFLLSRQHALPEFVAKADLESTLSPGPDNTWADDAGQYPCHTKAAAWVSLAVHENQERKDPKVAAGLRKYAAYWGLGAEWDRIKAEVKQADAPVYGDDDFAVVWVGDDGVKQRELRIANPEEVLKAASWLDAHKSDLSFADRSTIAGNVLRKAEVLEVSLPAVVEDSLQKQAGVAFCDPDEVRDALLDRARLCPEGSAALRDLAEKTASLIGDPGQAVSLVSTVDAFDRAYGLSLPPIEDKVFALSLRQAKEAANGFIRLPGGFYDKDLLAEIPTEKLAEVFGESFVLGVTLGGRLDAGLMAKAAATLSPGDVGIVEELLRDQGAVPIEQIQTRVLFERLAQAVA